MASPNRQYELVQTVTPDGVKLHGLFQCATKSPQVRFDAALILHGLGGNFYSSTLNLRLADQLVAEGIAAIIGNTRGHDGVSSSQISGRSATTGAAFEIVDDCRHDVDGWCRFLSQRGFTSILLVGHSLGAIKALYAAAHGPDWPITGVAGLSATRLCHQQFLASPGADRFRECFKRACELVDAGKGQQLIDVDFPFSTWMTAQAYRDKYGPEDRYDWLPRAATIAVPVLLLFGERELKDNPAFFGLWESASKMTAGLADWQMQIVENANHFYAGVIDRATEAVTHWIANQPLLPGQNESEQRPSPQ